MHHNWLNSRTPDRDFRCFYTRGKILSHIPVPARGKDKKNEQPRVGRTHAVRRSVTSLEC